MMMDLLGCNHFVMQKKKKKKKEIALEGQKRHQRDGIADVLVEVGRGHCLKREEEIGGGCVGGWGTVGQLQIKTPQDGEAFKGITKLLCRLGGYLCGKYKSTRFIANCRASYRLFLVWLQDGFYAPGR